MDQVLQQLLNTTNPYEYYSQSWDVAEFYRWKRSLCIKRFGIPYGRLEDYYSQGDDSKEEGIPHLEGDEVEETKSTSDEESEYPADDVEYSVTMMKMLHEHANIYERQYHYMECALLFYSNLKMCNTSGDVAKSFLVLVKMLLPGSLITEFTNSKMFTSRMNSVTNSHEVQSLESSLDSLSGLFGNFKRFQESQCYKHIYKLYAYILTHAVFKELGLSFDNMGYTVFEREAIKRKCHSKTQFVFVALETFVFLFRKGFQIIRTGRLDPILHNADNYAKWFDEVHILKLQSRYLSNPEANDFDEFSFKSNLDRCIDQGNAISKCLEKNDKSLPFVKTLVRELLSIKFDVLVKQDAKAPRKEPFPILVSGRSGIGKSMIKNILISHFCKVKGVENDPSLVFTKNPVAKYWDGFTSSIRTVVLDDVAFMNPDRAMNGDPSCMEFLQIVNAVPYVPDQAALEDKGRTPLKAELVIATTNTKDLNVHHYFSCPVAAARRFPFVITPELKITCMDDQGLLKADTVPVGTYPNWWTWKVERVVVTGAQSFGLKPKFELVGNFNDINSFLDWYAAEILTFSEKQKDIMASISDLEEVAMCVGCKMMKCVCKTQGDSSVENNSDDKFICMILFIVSLFTCFGSFIFLYLPSLFSSIISGIITGVINNLKEKFFQRLRSARNGLHRRALLASGRRLAASITPVHVLSFSVGVFAIYKIYKLTTKMHKQSLAEVGQAPKPLAEENVNTWYANDFQLTPFHTSVESRSTSKVSTSEFVKVIERDIVMLHLGYIVDGEPASMKCNAFCLRGKKYLSSAHAFKCFSEYKNERVTVKAIFQSSKDGVTANQEFILTPDYIKFYDTGDYVLLDLIALPPKKGLWKYMARDILEVRNPAFYVSRRFTGEVFINDVRQAQRVKKDGFIYWNSFSESRTIPGDSGSPLITKTPMGFLLIGIHAAGNDISHSVMAAEISASSFEQYLQCEISGPESLPTNMLGSLHHKSVFRFIDHGFANVYGSFTGARSVGKSRVGPTLFQDFFVKRGHKVNHYPPNLTSYHPWRLGALDLVRPNFMYDPDRMNVAINCYFQDIMNKNLDLSMLHPYDITTAVNGAPGVAYVDSINKNSSAGFPYRKSKKFFLRPIPAIGELLDPVEITEEIQENLDILYKKYLSGTSAAPIFIAHLKDEPISWKKYMAKKARVFSCPPIEWIILVRMFYLSLIRLIQNNPLVFETAVGITAQSDQWHQLREHLVKHGEDRIVAGDFAAFDKQMCYQAMDGAFEIMIHLMAASGNFTEQDLMICKCIKVDTIQPFMDYNGDLVQFFGTNPSGHPMTVILNSMVNSIYMRYVFSILSPDNHPSKFTIYVNLTTYGDDNIMGVSVLAAWFNHTAISEAFKSFGIEYTMPNKEAESKPYLHIDEATFLKRSWRYMPELDRFVGPLDVESLNRNLTVWVASKSICREEQGKEILISSLSEYFWYGPEVFHKRREMYIECWKQYISSWDDNISLPTWDGLINEYWNLSKKKKPFLLKDDLILGSVPTIAQAGVDAGNFYDPYDVEDIFKYPKTSSVINYELPWQITNIYFVYIRMFLSFVFAFLAGQIIIPVFSSVWTDVAYLTSNIEVYLIKHQHNPTWKTYAYYIMFVVYQIFGILGAQAICQCLDHDMTCTFTILIYTFKYRQSGYGVFSCVSLIKNKLRSTFTGRTKSGASAWVDRIQESFYELVRFYGQGLGLKRKVGDLLGLQSPPIIEPGESKIFIKDTFSTLTGYSTLCDTVNSVVDSSCGKTTNIHTIDPFDWFDFYHHLNMMSQSDLDDKKVEADNTQQEVLTMDDEASGEKVDIPAPINYVMSAGPVNAELANFLERPVNIATFQWDIGANVGISYFPWQLFLNHPSIKRKIDNYYLLQGNLHVKIVVNASPFYYGALIAAYQPLYGFDPAPILLSGADEDIVPYSQRPHVMIYAQTNSGGELVCPFIYHKEWLNIGSNSDAEGMGQIVMKSIVPLANSNGASASVDIQYFAWMDNVRLAGPTSYLALQADSEYVPNGIVSKPASAVARATGKLSNIPVIGPFMTATSAIASGVGEVAHAFGFSNPPVVEDVKYFKGSSHPNLATTEISVPFEKLAVDSKNEITVDPKICGADLGDELNISSFASRESYLGRSAWTDGDAPGSALVSGRVSPIHRRTEILSQQLAVYDTPMAHVSKCFKYWRGSIEYRFKIICTPFHRGRIKFSWDPRASTADPDTVLTERYTKIVDISEETEFSVKIPWMQPVAYLYVPTSNTLTNFSDTGGAQTVATDYYNGVWSITAFTKLTGPATSNTINILTFTRCCDLDLAGPVTLSPRYSYYTVQSELSYDPVSESMPLSNVSTVTDPNINLVYMGEKVTSIRQVIRRMAKHCLMRDEFLVVPTDRVAYFSHKTARRPRYPGYDPDGPEVANAVLPGPPTVPYNFVSWHYLTWFAPCFVAERGTINWVYNACSSIPRSRAFLSRSNDNVTTANYYLYNGYADNNNSPAYGDSISGPDTLAGVSETNQETQAVVSSAVPFYSKYKFQSTSPLARTQGISGDDSNLDGIHFGFQFSPVNDPSEGQSGLSHLYVGAGIDYNLIFFLNIPVKYYYDAQPTPSE